MNSTAGSEYTENNIYFKLIFAFAAQSSLSKCVMITCMRTYIGCARRLRTLSWLLRLLALCALEVHALQKLQWKNKSQSTVTLTFNMNFAQYTRPGYASQITRLQRHPIGQFTTNYAEMLNSPSLQPRPSLAGKILFVAEENLKTGFPQRQEVFR